jgi:hypothetical protein
MSDLGFVSLRGYALQFMEVGELGGELSYFDHGAFNIETNGSVYLNFRTHDAPPIARSIDVFADDYGLGFLASVPATTWDSIRPAMTMRDGTQYCSGLFDIEKSELIKLADGRPCKRITRARLRHVTICSVAVFRGGACWPAEVVGELPPRLADLNAKWIGGRQATIARRAKPAVAAASRPATPDAFLASRREEHLRVLGSILGGAGRRGFAVGHAALSRKGLAALEKAVGASKAKV